jgi:hypothetical protein
VRREERRGEERRGEERGRGMADLLSRENEFEDGSWFFI